MFGVALVRDDSEETRRAFGEVQLRVILKENKCGQ